MNVNGALSRTAEAKSGAPKGFVMGLILLDIYVNGMSDHLSAYSLSYAEDVKFIAPTSIIKSSKAF